MPVTVTVLLTSQPEAVNEPVQVIDRPAPREVPGHDTVPTESLIAIPVISALPVLVTRADIGNTVPSATFSGCEALSTVNPVSTTVVELVAC